MKKVIRLLEMLKGRKTAEKKKLLNAALVVYKLNHRKQGFAPGDPEGYFQPNVWSLKLKHIFRTLKESGIYYQQADFKSYPGSYSAVAKALMAEVQAVRPDLGRLPFQASVECDDDRKLRECADPPYRPFHDPNDLLELTLYKVNRDCMFQSKEVSAVLVQLVFYTNVSLLLLYTYS